MIKVGIVYNSTLLGGGVYVALNIIEVAHEMGLKTVFITYPRFELDRLKAIFNFNASIIDEEVVLRIPQISDNVIYFSLYSDFYTIAKVSKMDLDIIVNTVKPLPYRTHAPIITYLHWPLTRKQPSRSSMILNLYSKPHYLICNKLFLLGLRKSIIRIANSEFTKEITQQNYPELDFIVIHPPVNTQFYNKALKSNYRTDRILVISRISPEKKLERAIAICKLLPRDVEMIIVGTLTRNKYVLQYLSKLKRLIRKWNLDNRVKILLNISCEEMLELMKTSKIYLHTMFGEHFGISIFEAMSAGLIPIVPKYGGFARYVPPEYQYSSIKEAATLIENLLRKGISQNERERIASIAQRFCREEFKRKFKKVIRKVLHLGSRSNVS